MSEILKIYILNVINDIDNVLIISAVIRKYGYRITRVLPYIVLCLAFTRTIYVMTIHFLTDIPGLRVITGLIIFWIAIRMAWTNSTSEREGSNPKKSIFQIMLIVIATDFTVCLDSVMITSELSSNLFFVLVGIFLSVATVFILFISFSNIFTNTSLIQIMASGLIAHIAILGIVKDPIAEDLIHLLEGIFNMQIDNWINVFALDISLIIVVTGVARKIQSRTPN